MPVRDVRAPVVLQDERVRGREVREREKGFGRMLGAPSEGAEEDEHYQSSPPKAGADDEAVREKRRDAEKRGGL